MTGSARTPSMRTSGTGSPAPRWRSARRLACAVAVLGGLYAAPLAAQTFLVDSAADRGDVQPGDGLCADALGLCTLRAAILEANALAGPQRIELPAGEFALALAGAGEDAAASGDLDLGGALEIVGAGALQTRIDGAALDRVFDIAPGALAADVRVHGLTIRGGRREDGPDEAARGGGVRIGPAGRLELVDSIVAGNRARLRGGGIDNAGQLLVLRSRIEDNQADSAGAGLATGGHPAASAHLLATVVRGNHGADIGGGIAVVRAPPGQSGFQFGTLLVERSALIDNQALTGSAFYADASGQFTLRGSTVSGNQATSGVAVFVDNFCATRIESSTIVGNTGGSTNGGLQNMHGPAAPNLVLTGTWLAGNLPRDCLGVVRSEGHNLIANLSACGWQAATGDLLGVALLPGPRIDPPGGSPHHPLPAGSPAIDAGGSACGPLDQLGQPRPVDGNGDGSAACDIGAIESPDPDGLHRDGFE